MSTVFISGTKVITRCITSSQKCSKLLLYPAVISCSINERISLSSLSSSCYVSKGLVTQNVKQISYKLENQEKFAVIKPSETKLVIKEPVEPRRKAPLVLLFGWGGASHKNLAKYADIYLEAGCTTAQYVLSTRHLFRDTAQIPELMGKLLQQLEDVNIYNRQVYVHCLSDTGVMCYQGIMVSKQKRINVRGVVWDSCPGPRPEITVSRVAALLLVNWFCCLRDNQTMMEALSSSYRLLLDRAWPGLMGKWKGEDVALSLVNGQYPFSLNFNITSRIDSHSAKKNIF